jgi:HD-GYP domain-containing protein (c-di-GMP phosphodiesterase class II)
MNRDRTIQAIVDYLRSLSQSLSMAALYTAEHPRVDSLLPRIIVPLQALLKELPELTLIVFNDDLLYQGKPLEREVNLIKLAKYFSRAGIGHVTFMPGVEEPDIRYFIRALHNRSDLSVFKTDNARIKVGVVNVEAGDDVEMVSSYNDLSPGRLNELKTVYDSISARKPFDARQLMSLVAGFIVAFRREYNPLMALTPIRNLDEYTFTHSINVGILNIAQGMSMGITGDLLHDIGVAGMLHDAGKIFVDRTIIQKSGALNDEEFAVMKTHPFRGGQYLLGQEGVPKLAVISAFEHHMRYDLNGYPHPPEGWELNLCSQMTMISDTFDALRTRRIYKDPWDFPVVCGHMLSLAGSQLNEDLTINFLDILARMGDGLPPSQLDDTVPARQCYCE